MVTQAILKMGNQRLVTPSTEVAEFHLSIKSYPDLVELIQNMKDTMEARNGVGIAAPQIGCNKRIIMFGFEKNKRYPNAAPVPFTILINPTYRILSEELVELWEGCLSIPCLRGLVPRYKKIEYSGYDLEGHLITRTAEDFHARIIQHECDHLDGILFPARLRDIRAFGYEDELGEDIY
jgi:peptide deformylase